MSENINGISISITDDHAIFRNGLVASFQGVSHIRVTHIASSGEELLEMLKASQPDVALVDMKMTGMDGIETTSFIKKLYPQVKVLGLSVYENDNYVTNMFKAGANGYLLKDATPEQIINAIECVHRNDYYLNEFASLKLLKNLLDMAHPSVDSAPAPVVLTQQEIDIIKLIGLEYTNAEIAEKMNLGIKTIENYRSRLMVKTGAKNTVGLVLHGIKKGHIII